MKEIIKRVPILGDQLRRIYWRILDRRKKPAPFPGSSTYWEERYAAGGNSGVGSYAAFAEFKAEVINNFVAARNLSTIIEFGCGDGNQLRLSAYPSYIGFDVSETVVSRCKELFKSDERKSFYLMDEYDEQRAAAVLSLDVIFHLVEDDVYEHYMRRLFAAALRYVIIYSSDSDDNQGYHGTPVKHRKFTTWVDKHVPEWKLVQRIPNRYPYRGDYTTGSFADFFIYEKV